MKREDRKLVWAAIIVFAIIAAELAWLLFVGSAEAGINYSAHCSENCEVPWWASATAWTCFFTFVLTISSGFMWWETRRMARGGDENAAKMERSIAEAAKAAGAMKDVAGGMGLAARAMERVAYQAELSNIQNRENVQTQFKQMRQYIAATQTTAEAAKLSASAALAQLQPRVAIGARGLQKNAEGRFIAWSNTTNTGGSTAYKLQILTGVQFLAHPLEGPVARPEALPERDHGTIDMPPRPESGHASARAMARLPTQEEMTDWRAGKCALYLFGTVRYDTEFGDTVEVDYCQFLDWAGYELWWKNAVSREGGVTDAIWRVAKFGNDTRIIRKS